MTTSYHYQGHAYTVALENMPDGSIKATVNERVYIVQAQALADDGWLLTIDNLRQTVYIAGDGSSRYVQRVGAAPLTLTLPETRAARRRGHIHAGDAQLVAQMPGQVVDVYVQVGDVVTNGQTLVVLEAMKMEIRMTAPADGVVKAVFVQRGAVVEREQALLELEDISPVQ
jgi:biotin carboxyl carrier protein